MSQTVKDTSEILSRLCRAAFTDAAQSQRVKVVAQKQRRRRRKAADKPSEPKRLKTDVTPMDTVIPEGEEKKREEVAPVSNTPILAGVPPLNWWSPRQTTKEARFITAHLLHPVSLVAHPEVVVYHVPVPVDWDEARCSAALTQWLRTELSRLGLLSALDLQKPAFVHLSLDPTAYSQENLGESMGILNSFLQKKQTTWSQVPRPETLDEWTWNADGTPVVPDLDSELMGHVYALIQRRAATEELDHTNAAASAELLKAVFSARAAELQQKIVMLRDVVAMGQSTLSEEDWKAIGDHDNLTEEELAALVRAEHPTQPQQAEEKKEEEPVGSSPEVVVPSPVEEDEEEDEFLMVRRKPQRSSLTAWMEELEPQAQLEAPPPMTVLETMAPSKPMAFLDNLPSSNKPEPMAFLNNLPSSKPEPDAKSETSSSSSSSSSSDDEAEETAASAQPLSSVALRYCQHKLALATFMRCRVNDLAVIRYLNTLDSDKKVRHLSKQLARHLVEPTEESLDPKVRILKTGEAQKLLQTLSKGVKPLVYEDLYVPWLDFCTPFCVYDSGKPRVTFTTPGQYLERCCDQLVWEANDWKQYTSLGALCTELNLALEGAVFERRMVSAAKYLYRDYQNWFTDLEDQVDNPPDPRDPEAYETASAKSRMVAMLRYTTHKDQTSSQKRVSPLTRELIEGLYQKLHETPMYHREKLRDALRRLTTFDEDVSPGDLPVVCFRCLACGQVAWTLDLEPFRGPPLCGWTACQTLGPDAMCFRERRVGTDVRVASLGKLSPPGGTDHTALVIWNQGFDPSSDPLTAMLESDLSVPDDLTTYGLIHDLFLPHERGFHQSHSLLTYMETRQLWHHNQPPTTPDPKMLLKPAGVLFGGFRITDPGRSPRAIARLAEGLITGLMSHLLDRSVSLMGGETMEEDAMLRQQWDTDITETKDQHVTLSTPYLRSADWGVFCDLTAALLEDLLTNESELKALDIDTEYRNLLSEIKQDHALLSFETSQVDFRAFAKNLEPTPEFQPPMTIEAIEQTQKRMEVFRDRAYSLGTRLAGARASSTVAHRLAEALTSTMDQLQRFVAETQGTALRFILSSVPVSCSFLSNRWRTLHRRHLRRVLEQHSFTPRAVYRQVLDTVPTSVWPLTPDMYRKFFAGESPVVNYMDYSADHLRCLAELKASTEFPVLALQQAITGLVFPGVRGLDDPFRQEIGCWQGRPSAVLYHETRALETETDEKDSSTEPAFTEVKYHSSFTQVSPSALALFGPVMATAEKVKALFDAVFVGMVSDETPPNKVQDKKQRNEDDDEDEDGDDVEEEEPKAEEEEEQVAIDLYRKGRWGYEAYSERLRVFAAHHTTPQTLPFAFEAARAEAWTQYRSLKPVSTPWSRVCAQATRAGELSDSSWKDQHHRHQSEHKDTQSSLKDYTRDRLQSLPEETQWLRRWCRFLWLQIFRASEPDAKTQSCAVKLELAEYTLLVKYHSLFRVYARVAYAALLSLSATKSVWLCLGNLRDPAWPFQGRPWNPSGGDLPVNEPLKYPTLLVGVVAPRMLKASSNLTEFQVQSTVLKAVEAARRIVSVMGCYLRHLVSYEGISTHILAPWFQSYTQLSCMVYTTTKLNSGSSLSLQAATLNIEDFRRYPVFHKQLKKIFQAYTAQENTFVTPLSLSDPDNLYVATMRGVHGVCLTMKFEHQLRELVLHPSQPVPQPNSLNETLNPVTVPPELESLHEVLQKQHDYLVQSYYDAVRAIKAYYYHNQLVMACVEDIKGSQAYQNIMRRLQPVFDFKFDPAAYLLVAASGKALKELTKATSPGGLLQNHVPKTTTEASVLERALEPPAWALAVSKHLDQQLLIPGFQTQVVSSPGDAVQLLQQRQDVLKLHESELLRGVLQAFTDERKRAQRQRQQASKPPPEKKQKVAEPPAEAAAQASVGDGAPPAPKRVPRVELKAQHTAMVSLPALTQMSRIESSAAPNPDVGVLDSIERYLMDDRKAMPGYREEEDGTLEPLRETLPGHTFARSAVNLLKYSRDRMVCYALLMEKRGTQLWSYVQALCRQPQADLGGVQQLQSETVRVPRPEPPELANPLDNSRRKWFSSLTSEEPIVAMDEDEESPPPPPPSRKPRLFYTEDQLLLEGRETTGSALARQDGLASSLSETTREMLAGVAEGLNTQAQHSDQTSLHRSEATLAASLFFTMLWHVDRSGQSLEAPTHGKYGEIGRIDRMKQLLVGDLPVLQRSLRRLQHSFLRETCREQIENRVSGFNQGQQRLWGVLDTLQVEFEQDNLGIGGQAVSSRTRENAIRLEYDRDTPGAQMDPALRDQWRRWRSYTLYRNVVACALVKERVVHSYYDLLLLKVNALLLCGEEEYQAVPPEKYPDLVDMVLELAPFLRRSQLARDLGLSTTSVSLRACHDQAVTAPEEKRSDLVSVASHPDQSKPVSVYLRRVFSHGIGLIIEERDVMMSRSRDRPRLWTVGSMASLKDVGDSLYKYMVYYIRYLRGLAFPVETKEDPTQSIAYGDFQGQVYAYEPFDRDHLRSQLAEAVGTEHAQSILDKIARAVKRFTSTNKSRVTHHKGALMQDMERHRLAYLAEMRAVEVIEACHLNAFDDALKYFYLHADTLDEDLRSPEAVKEWLRVYFIRALELNIEDVADLSSVNKAQKQLPLMDTYPYNDEETKHVAPQGLETSKEAEALLKRLSLEGGEEEEPTPEPPGISTEDPMDVSGPYDVPSTFQFRTFMPSLVPLHNGVCVTGGYKARKPDQDRVMSLVKGRLGLA